MSKVFANEEFGYRKATVERPLRLNFSATPERVARIEDEKAFQNLAKSKKRLAPPTMPRSRPGKLGRRRSAACFARSSRRWVTRSCPTARHSARR